MIELVEAKLVGANKECVPQTSERVQMCTIKSNQVEITNLEERKGRGMKA
jgi:hypothetical protein